MRRTPIIILAVLAAGCGSSSDPPAPTVELGAPVPSEVADVAAAQGVDTTRLVEVAPGAWQAEPGGIAFGWCDAQPSLDGVDVPDDLYWVCAPR